MMRSYVTLFCVSSTLIMAAVAALNYVVDPYLTHQWDTHEVQRLRPPREKMSVWGKTYAVARYRPQVVYIGNSRTELGMPVELPVFGKRSVFNAALSGASLLDAAAMASHAMSVNRLDTVIWGVDAPSFSTVIGTTDFDRALVADGGNYFLRRAVLDAKRALTLDMTEDSLKLLAGRFGQVCRSSLAFRGQRDGSCLEDRLSGWGGTAAAVEPRIREFLRGEGPTEDALAALDGVVGAMCRDGTRVRLYLNPTHAIMLDALYWAGKGERVEQWQRQLSALAARHRTAGCDLRVFDFSGFNTITTETIPQLSQRREMRYYWEPSHYRDNVGRMVMQRIFGGTVDVAPAGFGLELEPANIDAHLARQREQRDRYRREHPAESALARSLAQREFRPGR